MEHYLRRQGDKLVARVDAASDVALMRTMDLHDIGDPALAGARAEYREIASLYGHDAFLIEWEQVEFCGERSYREPVTAMRSVAQARKLSSARARLT